MKKTFLTALAIALCPAFSYADIITQVQINVQTQDKSGNTTYIYGNECVEAGSLGIIAATAFDINTITNDMTPYTGGIMFILPNSGSISSNGPFSAEPFSVIHGYNTVAAIPVSNTGGMGMFFNGYVKFTIDSVASTNNASIKLTTKPKSSDYQPYTINESMGYSYSWKKEGVELSTNDSLIATSIGIYSVEITDQNGCKTTATKTVSALPIITDSERNYISTKAYAVNNKIIVSAKAGANYIVYDALGNTIYKSTLTADKEEIPNTFTAGIYIVNIEGGIKKVIVR